MSKFRNICWWIFFMATAVCLQALVPGLDVLAVGLIILLQERDYKNMLWLLPLFVLLQEGMGTREFGGSSSGTAAVIALFKLGRWLFEVENFISSFCFPPAWARPITAWPGSWPRCRISLSTCRTSWTKA